LFVSNAAQALPVTVRGGADLRAQATFVAEGEVLELRGQLSDDARAPLPGRWIVVTTQGDLDLGARRGCPDVRVSAAPHESGLRVQSTASGELCLRWSEAPQKGTLRLRFEGDKLHGGAELEVLFNRVGPQRLATRLHFEPRPAAIDLDKPEVSIAASLDLALATAHAPRNGLSIVLGDERGSRLAQGHTSGDGKVRFVVKTSALADPGPGKLLVTFEGNEQLAAASDEQVISRVAMVKLGLVEAPEETDPGDDAIVDVAVSTLRAQVDGGVVEALHEGSSLGSAQVSAGRAELRLNLDPKLPPQPLVLSLRYLPASPYYQPGPALEVVVPVAPPSMAWRLVLFAAVLAAAVWVTASWRRSKTPPPAAVAPMLAPGVHVVGRTKGESGYRGHVVDAHDGAPLAGVTLVVRVPTLEGDGVVHSTTSDAQGAFAFDLGRTPENAELAAVLATHSEERRALPPPGTLRIALMTRRRAVLRRFIQWARTRGAPFDQQPEATPAHVRRVARERSDVERWAARVEQAAFGPSEVDEATQRVLEREEPGP
jgi:hypothetical protein